MLSFKNGKCGGYIEVIWEIQGEKQYWLFIHQLNSKNVITVRIFNSKRLLKIA